MQMEQIIVFSTLALALVLFIWGKFRHDITALICLLILTLTGVVPAAEAFAGFAHPAVITVAVILIVSRGLQNSGLIEVIGQWVTRLGYNLTLQVAVLSVIVCVASAFMNNIGALAVLMPVAIHISVKSGRSASFILMPIAFASLLGGMTTLIGTPPNIIIASIRQENLGEPFAMFDFMPVGAVLSVVGVLFIVFAGWRLLPKRSGGEHENNRFNIEDYITEVKITADSAINGIPLSEIKNSTISDILVLNVIRDNHLIHTPDMSFVLKAGDILTIEAESDEMKKFIDKSKTVLVGKEEAEGEAIGGEHITNVEAVVMADAPVFNQTASRLQMRSRYGVNLLAISRQGHQIRKRIDHVKFKAGDVLLLQGDSKKIDQTLQDMGCLPLADREFRIGQPNKIIIALLVFGMAIALVVLGVVEVQVAFTLAALLMILTKVLSAREIYKSVDWPIIVMLGAMLPLGTALQTSGGAAWIADMVLQAGESFPVYITLGILLVATMLLSNIINNAATAVIMAPLGIGIAKGLAVSADPFLMTIAIGSSAAFLTPIGHQSNTLVMGPGGYKFTDYIRMGIPVSLIIALLAVPLVLYFWPL